MPIAPALPCNRPRCPHRRPCPVHGDGRETYRERVSARPWAMLYDTQRWRRLSLQVRRDEPICRVCKGEPGVPRLTAHADHIVPHRGDRALFFARQNLQGLCHQHHSAKTKRGE